MKTLLYTLYSVAVVQVAQAQSYTLSDLEAQFLQRNTELIARKYAVDKADALIVQEKLWQNPTLSISEVNLWKTYNIETQPHLFGKYGTAQQIGVELEQVIETAGKRKKRVAIKQLEKQSAVLEYEELMRELKKELRMAYYSLQRSQQEEGQLEQTLALFTQLNAQYERQAQAQNIAKSDYLRVQTELLQLQKESVSLENDKYEALQLLRILTHNAGLEPQQIVFPQTRIQPQVWDFQNLITEAKKQNIVLKRQENEMAIASSQLKLEQAQRVPNLAVQMNYDRGGNIMSDFIGFGISMDLPVYNRNKGNIKEAELTINQQKAQLQTVENELEKRVLNLKQQLERLEKSLSNWNTQNVTEQKQMLENYNNHLQNKQVTLMEFIDFTSAQRESNQAYFELLETYHKTKEELQYIIGIDI